MRSSMSGQVCRASNSGSAGTRCRIIDNVSPTSNLNKVSFQDNRTVKFYRNLMDFTTKLVVFVVERPTTHFVPLP